MNELIELFTKPHSDVSVLESFLIAGTLLFVVYASYAIFLMVKALWRGK